MTALAYAVAAILFWLAFVMIRTAVRRWRSPAPITMFTALQRWSQEWAKGAVRGILVQGVANLLFGLVLLCFALAGLSGGSRDTNTAVADPVFMAPLRIAFVLWFLVTVVCLSIVFFNRPRSLVLPWLRTEPGAFAFWRQQRRDRRVLRKGQKV